MPYRDADTPDESPHAELSGADADSSANAAAPRERLQKVLAAAGLGSRRHCEEMITQGRVEVDRQLVTALGSTVDPESQEIRVDGERIKVARKVYYLVNKPTGYLSTNYDPSGRPRVLDLLPPTRERLFTVGRLDMSSEGLMLVTNDGELAQRLTHPRYGVEKTYLVQVAGTPPQTMLDKLVRGVHLAEGLARCVRVTVRSEIKQSTQLEIVLAEGKNREIRRILAKVGHKVMSLRRIAIGGLKLKDLKPGEFRRLMPVELKSLTDSAPAAKPMRRKRKPLADNKSGSESGKPQKRHDGSIISGERGPRRDERGSTAKSGKFPRPGKSSGAGKSFGAGKSPSPGKSSGAGKFPRAGKAPPRGKSRGPKGRRPQ